MSIESGNLIKHLVENDCYPDEEYENGTWYKNTINGDVCFIDNVETFGELLCCHIFYELRIPAIPDLEDTFEVYKLHERQKLDKVKNHNFEIDITKVKNN